MKSKKIFILTLLILVFFEIIFSAICFANNVDKNEITNDFEITSYSSGNGEIEYGVYVKEDDENKWLSIKATTFNLPSNLYDYKEDIRLRITYLQTDYQVLECKVINYTTGEIIEDLSDENINKLFNIEYGKNITKKNWVDVIKLSEFKENEIYQYTATATVQFPKIENDIGKNCIIYIKQKDDKVYEKKINMYKEISGGSVSFAFNEYNLDESFCIMYKKIGNDELLKLIENDEIIYLSNYNDGDKLEYQFESYIYNDTGKNIIIHIKNTTFGVETSNSVVIPKGEIYGFDWMIDSVTISYSEENNNQENNNQENSNQGNNNQENNNQEQSGKNEKDSNKEDKIEDKTIIKGDKLPNTGINTISYLSIIIFISIALILFIKINKYKFI